MSRKTPEAYRYKKRCQRAYPLPSEPQSRKCERCKRKGVKVLHRHHRDRNPANNAPENIQIACSDCHYKIHKRAGDWPGMKKAA
jgi:5-methylcytosine-specific restriction endonuclease McrA